MGIHEPCQVRKEAALSGSSHVPQGSLGRANCLSNACGTQSKEGARHLNRIHKLIRIMWVGFLFIKKSKRKHLDKFETRLTFYKRYF